MVFRLRGYRFRYLVLSIDWTREDLRMRPVDPVGTSCATTAHADESAMNNRWNQWNEETYLGLKRELRTGSLLAPVLRILPPGGGSLDEQRSLYRPIGGRHVIRQGSYPLQPGMHRRVASEVVPALRAEARVHIQGDVSDRGAIPNEEFVVAQMPLHNPDGPVSLLQELLQHGPSLGRHLHAPHAPQARPGEVG